MFAHEKDLNYLIKGQKKHTVDKNFELNPISYLVFCLFLTSAFYIFYINKLITGFNDMLILFLLSGFSLLILIFFEIWIAVIDMAFLTIILLFWLKGIDSLYFSLLLTLGVIMAPIINIAKEWERAIILRLGKFKKVKGPGLFLLIPFFDSVVKKVDLRIRVTDFMAETTLTKDSVTVTVDALCFWLVWDAEKAICEVENYTQAVVLSSQTALRNAISMNDLSTLLERGEIIKEQIREEVDKKTTEWGITIQHIEMTDIQIPKELQDSMSRLAQSEREKKSRILLAEAEIEISKRLEEASKIYQKDETAFKLRSMNILLEGLKAGNSTMMVPASILDNMNLGNIAGLQALGEIKKNEKNDKKDKEERN